MSQELVVYDVPLPGIEEGAALGINEAFRRLEAKLSELENRTMLWYGEYVPGTCYPRGAVVRIDNGYLARAVVDTCESPTVSRGEEGWVLDSQIPLPAVDYPSVVTDVALRGQQYDLTNVDYAYLVERFRVLVPHDQTSQSYAIYFDEETGAGTGVYNRTEILANFNSTAKGTWLEYNFASLWRRGKSYRMWLLIKPEQSPVSFSAPWEQRNTNAGNIGPGELGFRNSQVTMVFHYTDNDSVDRTADLQAVPVGATITRGADVWTITGVSQGGSTITFDVSPGGQRGTAGVYTFQFDYGGSQTLYTARYQNVWTGIMEVRGLGVTGNGSPVLQNNHNWSMDIYAAQLIMSDDWELLTFPT